MSHFAVLVLHEEDQSIENLLAPYSENLEVEPYIKYTRIQAINKMRKDCPSLYKDKSENQFRKNIDEFSNTRINSINEDEFEIAEQNKSLFGEDKNIFESEEQYLNSFAKEMNEFADNNMEINRDYYDI